MPAGPRYACADEEDFPTGSVEASIEGFFLLTQRGLTGALLVAVLAVMWVFALSVVHARSFLYWAGVPLIGFAAEHVLRLGRRAKKTNVVEAQALRSGVTRLELDPQRDFTWRPGDYAFLRIPAIAKHERHPFTISSAEESGALTFHIRSLGNWTRALRRRVERDEASGAPEPMTAVRQRSGELRPSRQR